MNQRSWTGAVNTSWSNSANWSTFVVPGPNDDVIIDINSANQPILDTTATINSLVIAGSGVYGSTLTMQNPLTANSFITVGQKGVITHTANATTELYKANITASSMTITGMIYTTAMDIPLTTGRVGPLI